MPRGLSQLITLVGCLTFLGLPASARLPLESHQSKTAKAQARKPRNRVLRRPEPWMVTVMHMVDLKDMADILKDRQIKISPVDAMSFSDIQLMNVTTGIVMDMKGHVLVRLVNVNPANPPTNFTVCTTENRQFQAKLVGLDGVTGLSVLQVGGLTVEPPKLAVESGSAPNERQVHLWMPAFGKNAKLIRNRDARNFPVPMMEVVSGQVRHVTPTWAEVIPEPSVLPPNVGPGGYVLGPEDDIVGFALVTNRKQLQFLPAATAQKAFDRIIKVGKSIPGGWLGVGGKDLALLGELERQQCKTTLKQGVVIERVVPQGPADKAGLRPLDVIQTLDGKPLSSLREFLESVAQTPAGQEFHLGFLRDGKPLETIVTLGEIYKGVAAKDPRVDLLRAQLETLQKRMKDLQKQANASTDERESEQVRLEMQRIEEQMNGLSVMYQDVTRYVAPVIPTEKTIFGVETTDLTDQLATFFGASNYGVLVNSVAQESLAGRSGIRAGDIILEIKGKKTPTRTQFFEVLEDGIASGDAVRLLRNKKPITVTLR